MGIRIGSHGFAPDAVWHGARGVRCALAVLMMGQAILNATGASAASPHWPDCATGEVVRYALDKANATGWQHDLSQPFGDETAWFSNGDLIIEREGSVLRYGTSGGGSGLRYRVGRAPDLPEGDPRATVRYITYDVSSVAAAGRPDRLLMINGDLYWPSCREDR